MKALAKEKDLLEREKWELRRQAKEATDHATALRSQLDLKDNRMKELEAELAMVRPRPFAHTGWGAPAGSGVMFWEQEVLGNKACQWVYVGVRRGGTKAGGGPWDARSAFFVSTTQSSICLPGARPVGMLGEHPLTFGRENTTKLTMVISG